MARSKNSTALFEVIHTAKKPPKSSTTVSVPTPKWWAKTAPKPAEPKPKESPDPAGRQGSWLAAAAKRGVVPTVPRSSEPVDASINKRSESAIESDLPATDDVESGASNIASHHDADVIMPASEAATEIVPRQTFAERVAQRFAKKPAAAPPTTIESIEIPAAIPAEASTAITQSNYSPVDSFSDPVESEEPVPPLQAKTRKPARSSANDLLSVDHFSKEVRFRLSYGGMIALGFIFIVLLAAVFLIGSRWGIWAGDSQSVDARTGMLIAVSPTKTTPVDPKATTTSVPPTIQPMVRPDVMIVPQHPRVKPPVVTAVEKVRTFTPPEHREVGAVYIVVQSYPDQPTAQRACDFLNNQGISCSVVQGLGGWAMKDWYSVVGTFPFKKGDATLDEYEHTVAAMGPKFSKNVLNQFQPRAYNWQSDSDRRGGE